MATLTAGGSKFGRFERLYASAHNWVPRGEPNTIESSTRGAGCLKGLVNSFDFAESATIASSLSFGSSISVLSLQIIPITLLLADVSPASRIDTGPNAVSDFW